MVVLSVDGPQFETGLGGRLLVVGARPLEFLFAGGADGEEAGVFQFGVSGDELRLPFEDRRLDELADEREVDLLGRQPT